MGPFGDCESNGTKLLLRNFPEIIGLELENNERNSMSLQICHEIKTITYAQENK